MNFNFRCEASTINYLNELNPGSSRSAVNNNLLAARSPRGYCSESEASASASSSVTRQSATSSALNAADNKKPILYMQFQDASDIEANPYWAHHLQLAARGIFRDKKIKYDGKCLVRTDIKTKEIVPSNPDDIAAMFIAFHEKYSGVSSGSDIDRQVSARERAINQHVQLEWNLCSKKMKRALLFEYADRCRVKLQPTPEQFESLRYYIHIALRNCLVTANRITMVNSIVTSVSCITRYDDGFWGLSVVGDGQIKQKKKPVRRSKVETIDDVWERITKAHTKNEGKNPETLTFTSHVAGKEYSFTVTAPLST